MEIVKFFGENWDWIAGVLGFLVTLIISVVSAVKTKNWGKVKSAINKYVKEAEILNADGTLKKEIVMSKARILCSILHIRFDDKKISSVIEEIVATSKSVNAREKDKTQKTTEEQI